MNFNNYKIYLYSTVFYSFDKTELDLDLLLKKIIEHEFLLNKILHYLHQNND